MQGITESILKRIYHSWAQISSKLFRLISSLNSVEYEIGFRLDSFSVFSSSSSLFLFSFNYLFIFVYILYYFIWFKLYLNCLPDSALSTMFFFLLIYFIYILYYIIWLSTRNSFVYQVFFLFSFNYLFIFCFFLLFSVILFISYIISYD